jgi:hypothetical protein
MASYLFDSFDYDMATNAIDADNDTFYALLTTSSYTPDRAHSKRNQITNEVSGTGYTAGGVPVAVTVAKDTTLHRTNVTFGQASWAGLTLSTARYLVYYKRRGGASSADELVGYIDFAVDKTFNNETLTVSPSIARFQK